MTVRAALSASWSYFVLAWMVAVPNLSSTSRATPRLPVCRHQLRNQYALDRISGSNVHRAATDSTAAVVIDSLFFE
jgi:hypothetical protein